MIGVFRLESQMLPGNGKFERTGLNSDGKCKGGKYRIQLSESKRQPHQRRD